LVNGTTYQNTFSQVVMVNVFSSSGAIETIAINNVQMGGCANGGCYILYGGDNITITFSSMPNWNWQGLVDNDQTY